RRTSMPRRHVYDAAPAMDPLEQRALFDTTSFASVGLAYENLAFDEIGTTVFSTEGQLDTVTGNAIGNTFAAGQADRFLEGPLFFSNIEQLDTGRFLRHPDRGSQGSPVESNGARFLSRDGFSAGWWFADFGNGQEEVEWIVERPTDALRSDFQGTWRFASIAVDNSNDDFSNAYGDLVIDATSVRWFIDARAFPRFSSSITSHNPQGLLKTSAREYFYISRDRSVLVFADMAENDSQIYIGVAVREAPVPFEENLVGDYLLAWAFADGPADFTANGEV